MKNSIASTLKEGIAFLKEAGLEEAALDARIILCDVLSVSKEYIFTNSKNIITLRQYTKYKKALQKRKRGICTAYITGHKEFRYISLYVTPDVLVPRADTEILVEAALECIDKLHAQKNNAITILDLCCGSGAIALSLLNETKNIKVYASDISHRALKITKLNAKKLKLKPYIKHSNLFSAFCTKKTKTPKIKFDLIVSNPPYICTDKIKTLSTEVQNEPHLALDGGKDGLAIIQKIISESKKFLKPNGYILLEADPAQMKPIIELYKKHGFKNTRVIKDLAEDDRVFLGS
ncbi:MAG: peptide chain release factor N(5)-glutamine methyltransferase [Termitinemataceae bacterium]|nr:MAG: peptide chain release factor N(5)-glutamine methyltransferase [Termitinemataceae bacterium]